METTGMSDMEQSLMKFPGISWSQLTEEEKVKEVLMFLYWIDLCGLKEEFQSNADIAFIEEINRYLGIYNEGERKAQGEMKQALLSLAPNDLQSYFDNLKGKTIYNRYYLSNSAFNELFEEMQPVEYLAILNRTPWMDGWRRIKYGLADDRRLFSCVTEVINEADLEGLLGMGAPADEYEAEVGDIVNLLKSTTDVDEIACGVNDVFCKWFGHEKNSSPVTPQHKIIAGKLLSALGKNNTFR